MAAHACKLLGRQRQRDLEFEGSLGKCKKQKYEQKAGSTT